MSILTFNTHNPLAACPNQVERVYITRGDNVYNEAGVKCDKMMGVMIKGEIHWIDRSFAYLYELENRLESMNIMFCANSSRWGTMDAEFSARLINKITPIKAHHDDIFTDDSYYMKLTKVRDNGSIWWKLNDFIEAFFTVEKTDIEQGA